MAGKLEFSNDMGAGLAKPEPMFDPQIEAWFTYHAPNEDQQKRYAEIRAAAKNMAYAIKACSKGSADQSAAFRLLRECIMTVNASIALEGKV
jgi:hypothetical protein